MIALLQIPLGIPFGRLCGEVGALIIQFFSSAQAELDLDPRALEIDRKGYQGQPLLLLEGAEQAHYLPFVQQKAAHAVWVTVKNVALIVGGNVHSVDEHFAPVDVAPRVLQVDIALTYRFDLGAKQLNACLEALLDKVVVIGFFVVGNGMQILLQAYPSSLLF